MFRILRKVFKQEWEGVKRSYAFIRDRYLAIIFLIELYILVVEFIFLTIIFLLPFLMPRLKDTILELDSRFI